MTVVGENCLVAALMLPPLVLSTALSCCLECLLIILTGERLSDKHSGRPAGKRQTCELDFKIKNKVKGVQNWPNPNVASSRIRLAYFSCENNLGKSWTHKCERFSAGVALDIANLLILRMEDRIQNNVPLSLMAFQAEAGSCSEVAKANLSDPEVKFMASGILIMWSWAVRPQVQMQGSTTVLLGFQENCSSRCWLWGTARLVAWIKLGYSWT